MAEEEEIKIIGHRGAAGLAFENTLASVQLAIDLGLKIIEIDVWLTTDSEVIVFHDTSLDRLTGTTGLISEMSSQKLSAILLNNGDQIPTLKEVVALVKPYDVQLIVELKDEKALPATVAILEKELPVARFLIGSFYHACILNLKQRKSEIQTAIMLECVPAGWSEYLQKINPDFVVASIQTFNKELVAETKKQNRKLVFYTVNSAAEWQLALRAKPYGIITNFPDRFI